MKSFRNFIEEEVDLTANVESGVMDVGDHAVRNNINTFLNGELSHCFVTPYVGLERVNKVLANFHIFLPKAPYMENDHGVHVFRINQFNKVAGMRNDGTVVTKLENPYSLYFEWKRNEKGLYDIFSEIVTDDELEDLMNAAAEDAASSIEDDREEKLDEGTDYSYDIKHSGKPRKKEKFRLRQVGTASKKSDWRKEYEKGQDKDDDPDTMREAKEHAKEVLKKKLG